MLSILQDGEISDYKLRLKYMINFQPKIQTDSKYQQQFQINKSAKPEYFIKYGTSILHIFDQKI